MENCIFCKIINKEVPAEIIFENDDFLAFTPLEKVSVGHTLVIPKKHFNDIFVLSGKFLEQQMKVIQQISEYLVKENNATGINILNANGIDAQQSVFHLHFHLVPRYKNDNLDLWIRNKL